MAERTLSPGDYRRLLVSKVGSHAHGTNTPASDVDYRYVMLVPTSEILGLHYRDKFKHERDKTKDENFWELKHFLDLSLRGNPSTLEVLLSPVESSTPEGEELRALYPNLLQRTAVYHAHWGFAEAQRRTMLSAASGYVHKAKAHHLRVLYNGIELLRTGRMTVRIIDTPIGETVMKAKLGELPVEEVARIGAGLREELEAAWKSSPLPEKADLAPINDYLLRVRRANW